MTSRKYINKFISTGVFFIPINSRNFALQLRNKVFNPKNIIIIMANLREFKVGDILLAYGLDMGCHKCVCTIEVVSIEESGIVTNDDGCLFLTTWEEMKYANDYFPYSKEQKKAMQEQCDKEYNDWVDACNEEMERAAKHHRERNERLKSLIKEKGYFDGTHTIFELSGKSNFFHWKQYDILHINEDLQIFGMAEDEDTKFLNLDDLSVPKQWEIINEIENEVE